MEKERQRGKMKDQFERTIDYVRISITDRCNLRCRYCMPEGVELVSMGEILTYEEIETICREAAKEGITKLKITGGEPLVRRGCVSLVEKLKSIPGIQQVTMTTNGVLLEEYAQSLVKAGLDGINISLDSLKAETYGWITGRDEMPKVLKGIQSALDAGLKTKINVVLQKEVNASEWEQLLELAKENPLDVRFIEMMPIGYGKQFEPVSNEELLKKLTEKYPELHRDVQVHGNGPARYYELPGFQGSVGFISAIHEKFCDSCNRIRLTAQGELKPCLCYGQSYDLKQALRGDGDIRKIIRKAIQKKPKQHCFEQVNEITEEKRMVQIGG